MALALAASLSHADATLLAEDFSGGTTAGWSFPSGGGTLSVTNDSAGIGSGNALFMATTSNNRRAIKTLSQGISLGENDAITVTLDYRFATTVPNILQALDFRFIDSSDDSYMATSINPGSSASTQCIFKRTGDANEGKFGAFVHDTTSNTITFTVTRVRTGSSIEAQFDIAWAGNPIGSVSGGKTSIVSDPASEFRFDTLAIGFNGTTTDGLLIDNISVSTTADLNETPTFVLDPSSAEFQVAPGAQPVLPLLIRNTGFDATNITVALSSTSALFTVLSGPVNYETFSGDGSLMTNEFMIAIAAETPPGVYPDALSLAVEGYGTDGSYGASTNFISLAVLSTNQPTVYVSPNDPNISILGTRYIHREAGSVWFQRHSDAVLALTYPQSGFNDVKARTDTGITLTFKTDSDEIRMSFRMLDFNNRGAGYGVFENGTRIAEYDFAKDTNTPETVFTIQSATPGTASVFEVTLPSWANVEFFDMRIDEGASMLPYELPVRKQYVAMGDSITHGTGQQSYTHRTYPFKLAQALNIDLLNLAVGGSRVSVPIGEMLSEFPPIDVITVLIGYNDCYGDVPLGTYQSNLTALVTACRANQPNAAIFCITPTYTDNVATNRSDAYRIEDFRQAVIDVVATRQSAGDTQVYLVHGDQIITNTSQLLDGIHLLPDGAIDMANGLFAAMDPIVNPPPEGITHAHDHPLIDYDGVLFPKHTNGYVQLNRFSDALMEESVGFNVDRALVPSCVVIRFTTPSPTITAHFQTLETEKALKMPQYAVYRNGTTNVTDYDEFKFDGSVTNPVFTIISDSPGTNVMYEILLPSMNATAFKGLALENGYHLVTNAPYARPVFVAIGDSITMSAGFQSMSYETYTWKFGRARGMEVYNIAVGGATTAPDWGSMFPDLNPEFITVLFGINDWNTANDLGIFQAKYTALLDNIRADHPGTPLFCITLVAVNDTVNPIGENGVTVDAFRNEIIRMVNERRTAGDPGIYVINGHRMTESDDLADAFHFDQYGTTRFATSLNAAINEILVNSNYTEAVAIPANTFADWAGPYMLNAAVTNYLNDADGDGLSNLAEYGLGGDPTNATDAATVLPSLESREGEWINYVYRRRTDAAARGLEYTLKRTDNLVSNGWGTNGFAEVAAESIGSGMEAVTNRIFTASTTHGFVRLQIGTNP